MIKYNRFTQDDDLVRMERLQLVSSNVDTYSVELALTPDKLAWAQNCDAVWDEINASGVNNSGTTNENYQELQKKVAEAAKFYARLRAMLKAIIKSEGNDDELLRSYGFAGKSPRRFKPLVSAIDQWKETHDDLVAAGDSRVVGDSFLNKLVDFRETMVEFRQEALAQKRVTADIFKQKREIFANDTTMLQYLFSLCKLTWGAQESRLELLGFKTRSGVWTKKTKQEAVQ